MNSLKYKLLIFAGLLLCLSGYSQKSIKDSTISFGYISLVYSGAIPGGDFADRFGYSNMIGGEVGFKMQNNFYLYTGAKFVFGNDVRETVGENVITQVGTPETGFTPMAIGTDGRFYEIRFWERGFTIPLTVGRVFSISAKNPNSGIYLEAGGQFFQHKVLIEVIGNNVPYLDDTHRKGYDRLTNGLGLMEGIGYRHFSKSRTLNFFAGFELSQNFTRGRRSINFDTGLRDDQPRMDLLYGFKIGWSFPIYQSAPDDYYIY